MISLAILVRNELCKGKHPLFAFFSLDPLSHLFPSSSVHASLWRQILPGHAWALLTLDVVLPGTCSVYYFSSILSVGLFFSNNIHSHLPSLLFFFWLKRKKKKPLKKSSIFSTSFPLIWFDILPPPLLKALLWNNYWLSYHQLWWPLSLQAWVTTTSERNSFQGSEISAAF